MRKERKDAWDLESYFVSTVDSENVGIPFRNRVGVHSGSSRGTYELAKRDTSSLKVQG